MVHKYGRTWWGLQWLNALERIDYSNRLPRGRNYASKGAVKSIEFKKNVIHACVAGTRPAPYKIKMVVPLFSPDEQHELLTSILNNPILLSRLLNRELPASLLKLARERNIQIFPTSWRDIGMTCSCPDWAVPCKHIASVVYTIATSIDENPFLVFEMHGFDMIKGLENKHIKIEELKQEKICSLPELFYEEPPAFAGEAAGQQELPDYTQLPDMTGFLEKVLTASPIFYDRDFRNIIEQSLNKLSRFVRRSQHAVDDIGVDTLPGSRLQLISDEYLALDVRVLDADGRHDKDHGLMNALAHLERLATENRLALYDPSFQLLWELFGFVQALMAHAALVPRLLSLIPGVYTIQWIPARMDTEVSRQCSHFEHRLSQLMLVYHTVNKRNGKTIALKAEEQLNMFCSNLARHYFIQCVDLTALSLTGYSNWHPMISMFFAGHVITFGKEKHATPSMIHIWLRRLFMVHGNTVPLLRVDEDNEHDGFRVSVDVEMKA